MNYKKKQVREIYLLNLLLFYPYFFKKATNWDYLSSLYQLPILSPVLNPLLRDLQYLLTASNGLSDLT
ncbi:hypothetical protein J2T19_003928 [Paenibacillus tundrae]|uniref:Uncharacterized protein n=1 Tax=Paenibacillus tundrae TaxID=528187 RepID=A0ABT9WGS4_9BACL|nr:hypothetical protein [Paenibacillus tundrae]